MEKIELEVQVRKNLGKGKVKAVRLKGLVPGVVYGKGLKPIPVEVDRKKLEKILASATRIITLKISEDSKTKTLPVLTQDIQKGLLTDDIIHIDFHKIILEEEIKTRVPVVIIGEAPGVKVGGGIMVQGLREVEVKCLPTEIPDKFEIDISNLEIGDTLHVSDLKIVKGVALLTLPTESLVTIAPPAKEEVVAPPPEAVPVEVVPEAVAPPPGAPGAPPPGAPPKAEEAKEKKPEIKPEEKKK